MDLETAWAAGAHAAVGVPEAAAADGTDEDEEEEEPEQEPRPCKRGRRQERQGRDDLQESFLSEAL